MREVTIKISDTTFNAISRHLYVKRTMGFEVENLLPCELVAWKIGEAIIQGADFVEV